MRFFISINIVAIILATPIKTSAETSNLDLTTCLVSNLGKTTNDFKENDNNLSIEAGSIQAELGGRVDIQEQIRVSSGLSTITAEEASYDEAAGVLQIPKSVVFENPDLIILDLGLPDLEGIDLLKMLRSVNNAPVLVLTAREEEDVV